MQGCPAKKKEAAIGYSCMYQMCIAETIPNVTLRSSTMQYKQLHNKVVSLLRREKNLLQIGTVEQYMVLSAIPCSVS